MTHAIRLMVSLALDLRTSGVVSSWKLTAMEAAEERMASAVAIETTLPFVAQYLRDVEEIVL